MSALLAPGYDVEAAIRRTLGAQRRQLARLRAATRDLRRFSRREGARLEAALRPRVVGFASRLLGAPYYVERLRAEGLSPRDLQGPGDLEAFPILDREALRTRQGLMAWLEPRSGPLLLDRSSGSSGRPIRVLKDAYDTVHPWAVLRFWMRQLAVCAPRRARVALLCALPHGVEYAVEPPALGGGRLRRLSLARPEPLPRLLEFDPQVLFSDPAGLHWLLAQPQQPRPRIVLSSGQHLPAPLREEVRARLGAPVLNYYSTAETGPVAWECPARPGRFHVLHPDVWVESASGELLVTRLRRSALLLLRYRTGDTGSVEPEADCRCGYRGRSIVGLRGRRACELLTPDGRRVDAWCLAWLFKHTALSEFRLIQTGPADFRLELVAADGASRPALERRLAAALIGLGWPAPRLSVRAAAIPLAQDKPEPFRRTWEP